MKRIVTLGVAAVSILTTMATALWLAVPAGATAASNNENIQIISTSATSTTASVIASGVVTAGGVDHLGNKTDTLVFPKGSFKVAHVGKDKQGVNPKTCLFTAIGKGTFKISGGTGAYKGITGSGTYKLNILAILAGSSGKCSQTKPPVSFQEIVNATGQVSP